MRRIARFGRVALATGLILVPPFAMADENAGTLQPSPARAGALPSFDCVIEADTTVDVGTRIEGIVDTVYVERGDRVEAGQALADLDSALELADLALARARADKQAELEAKAASLGLSERRAQRNVRLAESRAISLEAKDEGETNAILAAFDLEQARQAALVANLEAERALTLVDQRTIRSPIDGVVVERLMSPGELATDQPLLRLARIDPLRVEVIVPAEHFGAVTAGMAAEILPEAPLRGQHPATVTIVDGLIDAASGTFGVLLELPNPDHTIPGGLRCQVRFLSD